MPDNRDAADPQAWPCYKGLISTHETGLPPAFWGVAESFSLRTFDHIRQEQVVSEKRLANPASGLRVCLTAQPEQHVCGEKLLRR